MKRFREAVVLILLLNGGCSQPEEEESAVPVIEEVQDLYMNDEGLIHAYPRKEDSSYLSESIGLYMHYLVATGREAEFKRQVDLLQKHFLTEQDEGTFIQWVLHKNTSVNALIDDIRIITALNEASAAFGISAYKELADRLSQTIADNQQHKGYTVDYYDWSIQKPAKRITLSYLISDPSETIRSGNVLKDIEDTAVFFPEYYDIQEERFIFAEEAHMVDQLLIAKNRLESGLKSPRFHEWVIAEWTRNEKLHGRYDRATLQPTVPYESLAVYYFLHDYFSAAGNEEFARQVAERAKRLAEEQLSGNVHFFDYIHYQLLLLNE
ncbi:hypothetical protein [Indiicoccus explosivorum]|uniref:hypothetical protein n=1 Tax=Indiicoccus explosivorum TaxID=1917864 RepID=UPI000B450FA6|nr:hypothetical protein [Indiicoccus explosivorum]